MKGANNQQCIVQGYGPNWNSRWQRIKMKVTLCIDFVLLFILISFLVYEKFSPEMHVSSLWCGAVTQHTYEVITGWPSSLTGIIILLSIIRTANYPHKNCPSVPTAILYAVACSIQRECGECWLAWLCSSTAALQHSLPAALQHSSHQPRRRSLHSPACCSGLGLAKNALKLGHKKVAAGSRKKWRPC